MKRHFVKRPILAARAIKGSTEISTEAQMTAVIKKHDGWLDAAIERANDSDFMFEYDDPESFGGLACEKFDDLLPEFLEENDYTVPKGVDPIDLVSDEVYDSFHERAGQGDFDF